MQHQALLDYFDELETQSEEKEQNVNEKTKQKTTKNEEVHKNENLKQQSKKQEAKKQESTREQYQQPKAVTRESAKNMAKRKQQKKQESNKPKQPTKLQFNITMRDEPVETKQDTVNKKQNNKDVPTQTIQKEIQKKELPVDNNEELSDIDRFLELAKQKQAEQKLKNKNVTHDKDNEQKAMPSFDELPTFDDIEITDNKSKTNNVIKNYNNKNDDNNEELENVSIDELIKRAETYYIEDWISTYEKAQRSRKTNEGVTKMKAGRFRYNKDHQLEFLPDIRTDNKSVEELLTIKWI